MKSVREDCYNNHIEDVNRGGVQSQSLRLSYHQLNSLNQQQTYSFNKQPSSSQASYIENSSSTFQDQNYQQQQHNNNSSAQQQVKSLNEYSKGNAGGERRYQNQSAYSENTSISGSNGAQISMRSQSSSSMINNQLTASKVMSRTDWFAFLKVAYNQLSAQNETDDQIDKYQFITMIELNVSNIPLLTLQEYLGSSSSQGPRKEKWLSYQQVIETLTVIKCDDGNFIHWDDIIDCLLVVKTVVISNAESNPQAAIQQQANLTVESSTVSNIQQEEYEVEKPIQKAPQQYPQQHQDFPQHVRQLMNKIVLKDQSILLDLSKLQDQYHGGKNDALELLQICCDKNQINNLRTISLSQIANRLTLVNISRLNSLVILNLSNMRNVDLNGELRQINLFNLQFLNISNNNLSEISISNHNFPKLKELYVQHNKFTTAKYFNKLDTLKLLDLSFNQIDLYEEILCLAFQEGLVVLNLTNNPLHLRELQQNSDCFEANIKQILPKILLLNPVSITKVSCFENFREIAFSVGQLSNSSQQTTAYFQENGVSKSIPNNIMAMTTDSNKDSDLDSNQGVVQRKINIKLALGNTQGSTADIASLSSQSTPTKSVAEQMLQKQTSQSNKLLHYQHQNNKSPYNNISISNINQRNIENIHTPPQNRNFNNTDRIDLALQQKTPVQQVIKDNKNELFQNGNNGGQSTSTGALEDTSNTYDSQHHRKLEQPQQLPVKNDSLKYFNHISRDTSSQQHNQYSLTSSIQKSPSKQTMINNFLKSDRQKPPRSIKIKPNSNTTSNVYENSTQRGATAIDNSIVSYQNYNNGNGIISSRTNTTTATQIYDNPNNNSAILAYRDQQAFLQNPEMKIKREMSAQIKQESNNFEVEISNFNVNNFNKRDNSSHSMKNKRYSINENADNGDSQSELAQYYERQLSSMNINTIREMASKEVCKIRNPSQQISQSSVSPIKAMMIQKPHEEQARTFHKYSNMMVGSNSNRSKRNSERVSMERQSNLHMTPISNNKSHQKQSHSRNSNIVKTQSAHKRLLYNRTSNSSDINAALNDSQSVASGSGFYQNRTQNINMKQHIRTKGVSQKKGSVVDLYRKDMTFNNNTNSSQATKGRNSIVNKQQSKGSVVSSNAGYGSNQQRGHSYSPSVAAGRDVQGIPFRLTQDEKLNLKNPDFIQSEKSRTPIVTSKKISSSLQSTSSKQLRTTSKPSQLKDSQDQSHPNQPLKTNEDLNTPRFSERFNQKKEAMYKDAIQMINHKRKKTEKKKQMIGQMTGKAALAAPHKQSTSSSGSQLTFYNNNQHQSRESRKETRNNGIANSQSSEISNQCTSIKIDLRQRRI